MKVLMLLGMGLLAGACTTNTTARLHLPELRTVAHVDLTRYTGIWYEISTIPQGFQRGCTASTATYAIREDGDIDVFNRCRQGALDGPERFARGRARIVDPITNAKLTVSFFRPFWGEYWIVDLGPKYEYAVVGHPTRDYLWVLSRTPSMEPAVYQDILGRLAAQGYETQRLVRTLQPPAQPAQ